jgi:hypothetical protein
MGASGTVFATQASTHYRETHELISPLAHELRTILAAHPGTTVGYEEACPKPLSQAGGRRNRFMWQLLPTIVSRRTSGVDIAIACGEAGDLLPPGGIALDKSAYGRIYAWVMPGRLQDDLLAQGLLERTS